MSKWYSDQDETFADYLYRMYLEQREEDAAWSALLAESAAMREPEEGEDLPKRSGMGRRARRRR